jgi:ABC-2 type transport system ATP-binding protein
MTLNAVSDSTLDLEKVHSSRSGLIRVANLHKQYGNIAALRGIDFEVYRGEIFGLIGPDGAGKTTTFHILSGVMEASGGNVEILGKKNRHARLEMGYLTQQFSLYLDLSINENLRYVAGLRKIPRDLFQERREKYLRLMNLEKIGDRLAGQLSGGMKQKLALCCALMSQPQILLLDEPTTGVDPVSRREFWDVFAYLASQDITIVVATPYLDEAERCNRIAFLYNGQIQAVGTLDQMRAELGLQRLEVRTSTIPLTEAVLQPLIGQNSEIVDVQTFGDRIDVLVTTPQTAAMRVRQALAQASITIDSLDITETTLENVFVTRLRQENSEPPFIPLPRLKSSPASKPSKPPSEIAIGAVNLCKVFGSFQAVKGVNLGIRYGEIYGLLGANGAGKTTTIKMLCGLLPVSEGQVILGGQKGDLRSRDIRQRIGYMSQKFTLYDDLTVSENLEFYCGVYGIPSRYRRPKIDWVLNICGLVGQEKMLTGRLPGGWKQRVAFGASVLHEPEILFLDEPTSGVDPLARRQFWRLINDLARLGTAVLVTTHYLEEAEQCNRMGFMVGGEVVIEDSPNAIKAAQPGQLLELRVTNPHQAAALLKRDWESWRVSIFGDRLHVVIIHPETEIAIMQTLLAEAELSIQTLRQIPFSLEDAFISIVQRATH